MADTIFETTVVPISPVVAGTMNEAVVKDDGAPSTRGQDPLKSGSGRGARSHERGALERPGVAFESNASDGSRRQLTIDPL